MKFHRTIMTQEVLDAVPEAAQVIVDGTVGHAGHMIALWKECEKQKRLASSQFYGCDIDPDVLEIAKQRCDTLKADVTLVSLPYNELPQLLDKQGVKADFILLDIGINWHHIWHAERGFSLKADGPLDMRFSKEGQTAYEVFGNG